MSTSMLLLTPVAVLLILFLFRFIGCDKVFTIPDRPGPNYESTITAESGLIAYWRLGEPDTTIVPGGTAIELKGGRNGAYNKATITADPKRHSPGAPGAITLGITPGLLDLTTPSDETVHSCIEVDGGFVEVPFDAALNPNLFTFEAWVIPEFGADPHNNFYCLMETSSPTGGVQKKLGIGLFAGPANPASTQDQPYQWQVWMGNGQNFQQVAVARPGVNVNFNQLTYLALTYDPGVANNNLILYLYYPGTGQDLSMASVAPLQATVSNFKPNDQPGGGTFLIGMGRNLFPGVAVDPVPLQPFLYAFKGKIQEVALYSAALGLTTLANHEMAGASI